MNRTLEEIRGLVKNIKNGMSGRAELDWINDIKLFIDSREQTIKKLREEVELQARANLKMFDKNLDNAKLIESLKCCGNCKTPHHAMSPKCVACTRGIQIVTSAEKKDNWIKR